MKIMTRTALTGSAVIGLNFVIGCVSSVTPSYVENIRCQYSFHGVNSTVERERIYSLAKQYAKSGTLQPEALPATSDFELTFITLRLSAVDAMHGPILFAPSRESNVPQQVFNAHNPTFSIAYDTAMIGASIEVTVHLTITPGAQLFYKPEGEPEKDLTSSVSANGTVQIKAVIRKDQDFIYAKTRSENVLRFVRINVHTQEVQQIQQSEYP